MYKSIAVVALFALVAVAHASLIGLGGVSQTQRIQSYVPIGVVGAPVVGKGLGLGLGVGNGLVGIGGIGGLGLGGLGVAGLGNGLIGTGLGLGLGGGLIAPAGLVGAGILG